MTSLAVPSPRPPVAGQIIAHLVLRELKIRYRRSVLGVLWALAQPLTRLLVFTFLFTRVLPLGIDNYVAFLFVGLTAWLWFSEGVSTGAASAVERRELLLQPTLPRWAIPLIAVAGSTVNYAVSLVVMLVYLLLTTGLVVTTFALPLVWLLQLLWMVGIALLLCTFNVFVRDVTKFVEMALLVGFYVTGVFYDPSQVPEHLRWTLEYNPIAQLLEMQRHVLLEGVLPPAATVLWVGAGGLLITLVGAVVFTRLSPAFIDEL